MYTDCLDKYSNSYFCKDYSANTGHCCKDSVKSKYTQCFEDSTVPWLCSNKLATPKIKSILSFTD